MLDLRERGGVDQQQPEAALPGQVLPQRLDVRPVRQQWRAGWSSAALTRLAPFRSGPAGGGRLRRAVRGSGEQHAIAAAALGPVERLVGGQQDARGVDTVARVLGDAAADAQAAERLLLGEREGVARDQGAELLGGRERLRRVGLGLDQQELLAAEAAEHVALAHALVHQARELLQQPIAGQMPVRVVVVLEVVDVEHEDRDRAARVRPGAAPIVGGAGRR